MTSCEIAQIWWSRSATGAWRRSKRATAMFSPRWVKLWRDAKAERGRLALMLVATAVSLSAFGAMLGAWAILDREITRSYASSQPAHATLELPAGVDQATLELSRSNALVAQADAREVTL